MKYEIRVINRHTVYQTKQSPCLAKYIKYNTEQRSEAENEFQKIFLQLNE